MRRLISVSIVALIMLSACSKSYHQTREARQKQKYYNALNLGQKNVPKPKF